MTSKSGSHEVPTEQSCCFHVGAGCELAQPQNGQRLGAHLVTSSCCELSKELLSPSSNSHDWELPAFLARTPSSLQGVEALLFQHLPVNVHIMPVF